MKRLLYIYNPQAGRQKARLTLAEVTEIFSRLGFVVTIHPTKAAGDATETVSKLGLGYDRIVCCGGDGTLNEVVSGLLRLPVVLRPPLGYIPTGTTNDFSRTLALPKSVAEQAELAASGEAKPIDVGQAAGRSFNYVAAFGLFTDVSYSTPQISKQLLGHFAYVLAGAGELANIPSYHMTVSTPDGKVREGNYIYGMVGNTVSVGGIVSLPRDMVKLDDGKFEVLLLKRPVSLEDWQSLLTALANRAITDDGPLTGFSADEVTFTSDGLVAWTLDGEFGGTRGETTVKNLQCAIRIAMGNTEHEPKPALPLLKETPALPE